jgi:hypothetical protein
LNARRGRSPAPPKQLWWIEETNHRFKAYNHIGEHPEKLIAFLETHLKK